MSTGVAAVRRAAKEVAAQWGMRLAIVAALAALAAAIAHTAAPSTPEDGDVLPLDAIAAHHVIDGGEQAPPMTGAEHGCATCGGHEDIAAAACLMVLVVMAVLALGRGGRASWWSRLSPPPRGRAMRRSLRVTAPDLAVLCICRT